MNNRMAESNRTGVEIAVIGMAGRFPGAKNIHEFWDNLKNGVETISFFSDRELEEASIDPTLLTKTGYVKAMGVLDRAEYFDAFFFGYTPAEAKVMDPQARLFHECAWEAFEDAGYVPGTNKGKIGVYAGASLNFHWQALAFLSGTVDTLDAFSAAHLVAKDCLTTRLSFKFDLMGPSFSIQTACSTSLVAIHLACQGLLTGECRMATAGGVAVSASQKAGYLYQEGMVLSPDGHCRTFDAEAKGFCGGNGVGVVVLKLLADAIADRDNIYAVIKGSAINNDGNQRAGFTAPGIKGQASVIKDALRMAEVVPESISYIEAHGTGTPLGDPIEIESLKRVFNTKKKQFCKIGSVKSNVGHLDAAAGVTGFIKTVLALKHRWIPPSLHFKSPNPEIDFQDSPFVVNTELTPWKNGKYPLRAGVSSFGIGGTNAHVVLEEWPDLPSANAEHSAQSPECKNDKSHRLLLLSAKTPSALDKMTGNLINYLKDNFTGPTSPIRPINHTLADIAYTLQVGRKAFNHRRMAVCSDGGEAAIKLSDRIGSYTSPIAEGKRRIVFIFSGLGSQYVNMGRELYDKVAAFREEVDRCFKIIEQVSDYHLKESIYPSYGTNGADRTDKSYSKKINRFDIAQLIIFVLEYALAKLLIKWGIRPRAMIGYSFGEYTAACISGVFSLEDALRLIVLRGELMAEAPKGAMLSVPLSKEELTPLLEKELSIAIDNGSTCIVAGPKGAVASLEKAMKKKKLMCMPVPHSVAMHSKLMEPILSRFEQELQTVTLNPPQIPYVSNVTGAWIDAREVITPAYWRAHLRKTVRFADGLRELVRMSHLVFIEIGPGRDLSTMVQRFIDQNLEQKVLNLIRPPQKEVSDVYYLLNKIGGLWLYGVNIDWSAYYSEEMRYRVPLPTYAFEKQRHRMETDIYRLGRKMFSEKKVPTAVESAEDPETESIPDHTTVFTEPNSNLLQRSELSTPYAPPINGLQKIMVDIWEQFFGVEPIGIHDDFFELGGDSLKAMNVSAIIQKKLNVEIPVKEFFDRQTIEELLESVKGDIGKKDDSFVEPVEQKEYYPVSSSQQRLYVLHKMGEGNTGYNVPVTVILEGRLNKRKFENAIKRLIKRHESYRTTFEIIEGEPKQKIHRHGDVDFEIEFFDVEASPSTAPVGAEDILRGFIRFFELAQAPLMRVGLIKTGKEKHILVVDMHHIITDGTSQSIIIKDFIFLYKGEELPELRIQYKDFSQWQNHRIQSGKMMKQEGYWVNEFKEEIPTLNLPADFARPAVLSFEGNQIRAALGKEEVNAFKKLASERETTLFMVLLAVFNIFLSKLAGQEAIVCGTVIAGRRHVDFQKIAGTFINTLALKNYPGSEKTFEEFLKDVKKKTLDAYENQDYQFESLVEKVVKNRDTSRNPLFDTMLILQNLDNPGMDSADLSIKPYASQIATSKFDLTLDCTEYAEGMVLRFEYSTRLFKEKTVMRFIDYFKKTVSTVIKNPAVKIGHIEIISTGEKEQQLYEFNDTKTRYPDNKTINELFEGQAAKTPDRIALVGMEYGRGEKNRLTYRTLNEKANQLARLLRERGVKPGMNNIVGIIVNRSLEMMTVILGTAKAGAAYLPIDHFYPVERINYILEDSGLSILLTGRDLEVSIEEKTGRVEIGIENGNLYTGDTNNLDKGARASDPAYVIYTSGSTGRPKGVVIEHRPVANFIKGITDVIDFKENDSILALTTISFDIFGLETILPLSKGSRVVIGDREEQLNAEAAGRAMPEEHISILQVTPSRLSLLMTGEEAVKSLKKLKYLIVGGEAFPAQLLEKIRDVRGEGKIYNVYGPTETTIWSTIKEVTRGKTLNIGGPIANTRIYILDRDRLLLPVGVPGNLWIAGDGLARGYLNRPLLTAEKFSVDPFETGKRMYKTGDLARWLTDGNIDFLGRIDHQLKIRGFRVEPGEIESQLSGHDDIDETVVISREDENGELYLCAYVTSGKALDVSGLRAYLLKHLPPYMVPSHFVQIEKIPLTFNRKVDRKALEALDKKMDMGVEYVAPKSNNEIIIAEIWREILKSDEVGIHDNFFDLGGTSVDIIRINDRLKEAFKKDIPILTMYRYTTIDSFAHFLDSESETLEDTSQKKARGDKIKKGKSDKQKRRELRSRSRR